MWIFLVIFVHFSSTEVFGANYRLEHEALNLTSYNQDYIINPKALLFQYNDTFKAYNISLTFKRDIGTDFKIGIRSYIFQYKAYRKFPYEYDPKVCDMFVKNDFGVRGLYNYSNFRGCPLKVNVTYYVANFNLDDKQIPKTLLLPGKYRVDATVFNKNVTYGTFEWYSSVVPDKQ